jgi:uncharacterized MAPEG superfamily protein
MNLSVGALLVYSILISYILIYIPFLVVGYARTKIGYDTSAPREMLDKLPAYAKRASWAHQNAFETFMPYAAAAILAYITGVNSNLAVGAAIAFVVARFFYSLFYIFNIPLARSLTFGIGTLSTMTLFISSILKIQ